MLLLPYRLWAADAMALQGEHPHPVPTQHAPCHTEVAEAFAEGGHGPHTAVSVSLSADDGSHAFHGTCLLCDVCHTALSLPEASLSAGSLVARDHLIRRVERVVSVDPEPCLKPPIA